MSAASDRQRSSKWQRTLRIVEWLVSQVPANSQYMVIRFANQASVVAGNNWKQGASAKDAKAVKAAFAKIIPEGGTNLYNAINLMNNVARNFSHVYLVTDGLPTQGKRSSSAATVSGERRLKLLDEAVAAYGRRAPISTILMPIEGDPCAAGAYWKWTASSNGLLIVPEISWP